MLGIIAAIVIGLALLGLVLKVIKYIPILLFLAFMGWLAYEYTTIFLWSAGGIFLLLVIIGWYGERQESEKIERTCQLRDASEFSLEFSRQPVEGKEKIVGRFLQLGMSSEKQRLIESVLMNDFFDYAGKQGKGDTIVFEKSNFEKYFNKVWRRKELMAFNVDWIRSQASITHPEWHVSIENPIDQKSGQRVDLIRVSKSQSVFANVAFDLDD
jgi:hypothetical protein